MNKLYLIDGANLVFRAFYAIRALSNSKGFPTNALYGFAQMLLKLVRDEKPTHIAVVFDTPEPTFRDEMYEDYKAHRKEPPDDLKQQFPYVAPLVEALGIPHIELPGFEADDLIGTIAKRFAGEGCDVVMVSGDKDLMQLVDDHISILDTMKNLRIGPKQVEERFGVGPEHVIDVLGLAGDSSDNVPGLPGVGPKTATKLIQEFGSIDDLIAHADKLKPTIRAKLEDNLDLLKLSRELVTIKLDVELDVELSDFERRELPVDKLHDLFMELEFTKLLQELAPGKAPALAMSKAPAAAQVETEYRLIADKAALAKACKEALQAGTVAIHVVTSSSDALLTDLTGVALAYGEGKAFYLPVGHVLELGEAQLSENDVLAELGKLLADSDATLVAHDVKFTEKVLEKRGVDVKCAIDDTMIAGFLVDPAGQDALDVLASRYLDHQLESMGSVLGKGAKRKSFAELDLQRACQVACERADAILRLNAVLAKRLKTEKQDKLYREMELPLTAVLRCMEMLGISVDVQKLNVLADDFGSRLSKLEKDIFKESGEEFNVMSPKQLGFILFEKLGLPGAKKTKTGYSTSQDVLQDLAVEHRLPALVIEYRQLSKLKSTYVDALPQLINPATKRIHTTFNQTATATGRLSSSDPNMQNIPIRRAEGKLIRAAFVANKGCTFVDADYSQIELRVLAHVTKDKALVKAFAAGVDVHAVTASGIFGVKPDKVTNEQRGVGKTVNFATLYGQTAFGLSRQLGIDVGEAQDYIEGYFKKYPCVEEYREEVLDAARKSGYVETLYGRRRYVPDITSSNGTMRSIAERMAFNTVFQGTAADIIKRAMIVIHGELSEVSKDALMLLQVHDELLFEVPEKDASMVKVFVKEKMEAAAALDVPLIVDVGVGDNWSEAH